MAARKRPLPTTEWLPDQVAVLSPDFKHAYAHTYLWDSTLPVLTWVLLHPLPNGTLTDRCVSVARQSGFGGVSIRYLFTLITTNQEDLVDQRVPNAEHANLYLATTRSSDGQSPVMAAWKLRGGTSELKAVVAARVAGLARTSVALSTPDAAGRKVLSPTQFPDNLRVDGYQPLRYTSDREATITAPAPRVLVTGSRTWNDGVTMRRTLAWAWGLFGLDSRTVLIEGECHLGGADRIAREAWEDFGLPVEQYPAAIDPETGRTLGPERNARMVASGAHLCLAFPNDGSRGGTRNCAYQAAQAGIPLVLTREWTHRV